MIIRMIRNNIEFDYYNGINYKNLEDNKRWLDERH